MTRTAMTLRRLAAALLLAGLNAPGAVYANLVVNGSFEDPAVAATITDGQNPVLYRYERIGANGFTGWTHGAGAPLIDSVAGAWEAQDGSQYTEAESGFASAFSQTLTTVAGGQYVFSLYVAPNPHAPNSNDDMLRVLWDGIIVDLVDLNSTTTASLSWNLRSYLVIASGSSTEIRLEDAIAGAPSAGPYLDNVSVVAFAASEPASWALFGLGALALGLCRGRRRARRSAGQGRSST